MNIVQLRVDSRLIHGQVANFWTNHLAVDRIIVISDEVTKSKIQVEMLRMSCPRGCKLSILQIDSAISNLKKKKYDNEKILIITEDVITVSKVFEDELMSDLIKVVNLGNIPKRDGTKRLTKTVYLTASEIDIVKSIVNMNVKVILQMVPSNQPELFSQVVKSIEGGK